MNKRQFLSKSIFALVIFSLVASGAYYLNKVLSPIEADVISNTYYVATDGDDTNPGTEAQPWATLYAAEYVVQAGDTVIVGDGTYNVRPEGQGRIVARGNGTKDMPITYKAENSKMAVIDATGALGAFGIGGSWIRLQGFSMVGDHSNYMILMNGDHNVIDDCQIVGDSDNQDRIKILVGSDYNEIKNCYFADFNKYDAIDCFGAYTDIHHNLFENLKSPACGFKGGYTRHNKIHHNIIRNVDAADPHITVIWIGGWSSLHNKFGVYECEDTVVYDNIIINTNVAAIEFSEAKNCAAFNNTIIDCKNWAFRIKGTNTNWQGGEITPDDPLQRHPCENITIANNIISTSEDLRYNEILRVVKTNEKGLVIKNNLWHRPSGNQDWVSWITDAAQAGNRITYGDFQALTGHGEGAILNDPEFTDRANSDFHLLDTSPAIDAGIDRIDNLFAPYDDFDGIIRPQGAGFDIGTFEFITGGDAEAPSMPQDVSAQALSCREVRISWSESTDDTAVAGYKLYRDDELYRTVTSSPYNDRDCLPDTVYTYYLIAYDAAGNESGPSLSATATTFADTEAPTIPDPVSAQQPGDYIRAYVSWPPSTDNSGCVSGYRIFRDGTEIATDPYSDYTDSDIVEDTLYTYEVSAYDSSGNESEKSEPVQFIIVSSGDIEPPTIPQNLTATAVSSSQIDLSWSASTDNVKVTGYRIYRDGTETATTANTSYQDTGLTPETTYTYEVSAYDAAGNESDKSNSAQATTLKYTNHPPVLDAIGNKSVDEGSLLTFTISATDPDDDDLSYSASTLPSGSSFNSSTQAFSWTPTYNQADSYQVTFTVSDGDLTDSETITITVNDIPYVNHPPVLSSIGNKTVDEHKLLQFQIKATDLDGDTLTYSATNLPSGASFDKATRTFSWVPSYSQSGKYSGVHFEVSDGTDTDYEDITITVNDVNQPPKRQDKRREDINEDGRVDLLDLSILAAHWYQRSPSNARADVNQDGIVDLLDLSLIAASWEG